MVFPRVRILLLAGSVSLPAISGARSTDLPLAAPAVPEFSGWYLRGDIGFSNQSAGSLFNTNYANFASVTNVDTGLGAPPLFLLGVGYTFNNWLRFDVTGEYSGAANSHGFGVGALPGVVGAGVGASRNTISNFGDIAICVTSLSCSSGGSDGYGGTASTWSFGIAYQAWRNVTLELAYRYIDLGNAQSGDLTRFVGTNHFYNPKQLHHLTSQDAMLGVGGADYQPPPPPLSDKG